VLRQSIKQGSRDSRDDVAVLLEDRGHRVTDSRLSVVRFLDRTPEGTSAEELVAALPGVGRATVYRTLKLLLETGVVCKLSTPGGAKYSLARVGHHHHTVCVRCGTVGDFRDATIERFLRGLGDDIAGEIVGHRIEIDIVCQAC
jgi:Fe2+ or Zn2+ uptake regulation protein